MPNLTRTHRRRSLEEWQSLIEQQHESKLSQRDFCRQRGLALSSFRNWKRRLSAATVISQSPDSNWLALPGDLTQTSSTSWEIELDLGSGVSLRLRQR